MEVFGHLAGEKLNVAGAEQADGRPLVADGSESVGPEAVALAPVEVDEVEAVGEDEDVGGVVAAAAETGDAVAAGAGVGVGAGDAVEVVGECSGGTEVVGAYVGGFGSARAVEGVEGRGEQELAAPDYLVEGEVAALYVVLAGVGVQGWGVADSGRCGFGGRGVAGGEDGPG